MHCTNHSSDFAGHNPNYYHTADSNYNLVSSFDHNYSCFIRLDCNFSHTPNSSRIAHIVTDYSHNSDCCYHSLDFGRSCIVGLKDIATAPMDPKLVATLDRNSHFHTA